MDFSGFGQLQRDPDSLALIAKLSIDPAVVPNFTLSEGVLKFKNRMWIGPDTELQQQLITACHSSALGGHSGIPVTYQHMKRLFAWTRMKSDISKFVSACLVCQQAKPDRSRLSGLLQPLEVPSGAWQIISLDFVEGLHQAKHANCIWWL